MAQALEGINVVGFTSAAAGPVIERYLGDFGATVVHIESGKNVDIIRSSGPYKDDIPGIDRSAYFASFNPNKYSLAIDTSKPESRVVLDKLVRWADIIIDNWVPGTLEKWGIGYEDVSKIKPGIIMCRSSNQGQTGPHSSRRGFGLQLEALAGFQGLAGWSDSGPQAVQAYTDFISANSATSAILAALIHRNKTGKGQLLDVSQYEAGVNFLGPCFLEYFTNGNELHRMGNSCPYAAPHGAFRCRGDDRWCNITVFTDTEWQSFCQAIGNPEWTKDCRFATASSRKQNEEELNRLVESWTIDYTPGEIMMWLQSYGIAAGIVEDLGDLLNDPQIKFRGFLNKITHPVVGSITHMIDSIKMSRTPPTLRLPGPCMGEHSLYVCKEFLGISDAEIDELIIANVFS